ncbi:MAG: sulfide/dihydroorotate dehydrogenase-like FAD/NAD-binding protein [Bacteroides sp.]|nr:sulfide/dihydroorotate dehydrogenase-like FAD/NAD-binding protein [Bacillota bacterium]MCM1393434.1 sulfide/dihydroorotate dehydrogenase-like FAD/NAD-binding protein [[Eubacterium] siraeum]MCM1455066.1 sulfide/dihydroorotate dehydrogenase-like FAD/NAD-binding protein [Bacteroides sp.]
MKNFEIVSKRQLAENVHEYEIYAPLAVKHCLAGQFIILRTDEDGERVPFTICDYSRENGTVKILVQEIGYTTLKLSEMQVGDTLADFVGPLGNPTDLAQYNSVCLVGGGIGTAVIYPQAKQLFKDGKSVDVIVGARNKELLMYLDEFLKTCDNLYLITDDGSNGNKGFVTDMLRRLAEGGKKYDCVFAVGPLPMMRAVCNLTKELGIKTIVSMNSLMVDGTGMCGCCRLTVGGEIKYACIDGPEFDGHCVDFEEAILRSRTYREQEQAHVCNLRG